MGGGGFSRAQMKALTARLDAGRVRLRDEDGVSLPYLEGWQVIAEANRIFGFEGWDRVTLKCEELHLVRERSLWHATYRSQVRVIVRAGCQPIVREGTGTGQGRAEAKAQAIEMGLKAAETDATKRALATFGNRFGLALYDPDLAHVEGVIREREGFWVLLGPDGRLVGRYRDPTLFCAAFRKQLAANLTPAAVARLWALNSDMVADLETRVPDLTNRSGAHFATLLWRLIERRLQGLMEAEQRREQKQRGGDDGGVEKVDGGDATGEVPGPEAGQAAVPGAGANGSNGAAPGRVAGADDPAAPSGRIDKSALALGAPPRRRDKAHLRAVAQHPCLICGRQPAQAHHLTFAQPRGLGQKVSDEFTVPLCTIHHRELHSVGDEARWWQGYGIDPMPIAARLWEANRDAQRRARTRDATEARQPLDGIAAPRAMGSDV